MKSVHGDLRYCLFCKTTRIFGKDGKCCVCLGTESKEAGLKNQFTPLPVLEDEKDGTTAGNQEI